MLVIHPKDRDTPMFSALYEGTEAKVVNDNRSVKEVGHLLDQTPPQERIMLLGKGSWQGLHYRKEDADKGFERIIVGHPHAGLLRRHGGNLISIWSHAARFARREGLHGLFTREIITNTREAESYGNITLRYYIEEINEQLFAQLRKLLEEGTPLHEIPERMKDLNKKYSTVPMINYGSFVYL